MNKAIVNRGDPDKNRYKQNQGIINEINYSSYLINNLYI